MGDRKLVAEKGDLKAYIIHDDTPQDPNEWGDKELFLVAWHREFTVNVEGWDPNRVNAMLTKDPEGKDDRKEYHVFPFEAHIHSGVSLSLVEDARPFPDQQWDVSRLGAVLVNREEFKSRAKARKAAKALVEEWQYILDGHVYGYVIVREVKCGKCEHVKEEHVDSCWGFFGEAHAIDSIKKELDNAK